jgi:hypothetical protein
VEILTEDDGSQISFVISMIILIIVSGGSHIKVMNKIMEVRDGHLWVQSENRREEFSVQTSNSNAYFIDGEFIVSYNSQSGKSQVLVVNGEVSYSNILEAHLKYPVQSGQFSFVEQNFENGRPRNPTNIGFKSFKTVMSLFEGVKPADKGFEEVMTAHIKDMEFKRKQAIDDASPGGTEKGVSRKIASVEEKTTSKKIKKGKIIFLSATQKSHKKGVKRNPASAMPVTGKAYFHHLTAPKKKTVKKGHYHKKAHKKKMKKATAPVRVFDFSDDNYPEFPKKTVEMKPETPALKEEPEIRVISVPSPKKVDRMPASVTPVTQNHEERMFEQSLKKEYEEQKKHPEEVNELIDELKNYREDFNKYY